MKTTILMIVLFISPLVSIGDAQNPSTRPPTLSNTEGNNNPPPSAGAPPSISARGRYLTSREFVITTMVVMIGLIALAIQFTMLKSVPGLRPEDILRVSAVTLIIIGTLFFIAAGFDSNQIAPAMGLFGTVAGYLLGRNVEHKGG